LKVRTQGGFIDLLGDSVFSDEAIKYHEGRGEPAAERVVLTWHRERREIGDRSNFRKLIEVTPADNGAELAIDIWRRPEQLHYYVIGGDVAEGKLSNPKSEESPRDYSVATVWDRRRREVVAIYRGRTDPHTFGKLMWIMGHWYNYAWISPEINAVCDRQPFGDASTWTCI